MKKLLKVSVIVLAMVMLVGAFAAPALASHNMWIIDTVVCDSNTHTTFVAGHWLGDDPDSGTDDFYVNGVGVLTIYYTGWNGGAAPYSYSVTSPAFTRGAVLEIYNYYYNGPYICAPVDHNCGDGRVNQNCAAPVAVYCDSESIEVWTITNEEGTFSFSIDPSTLPASVSADKLIKQVGQVKVYMRADDGLLMLLAPQSDGKIYYMLFDAASCVSTREGAEWGLK